MTGEEGHGGSPLRLPVWLLDRVLRRLLHIAEYSGHPHCLLRFARSHADREIHLGDGAIMPRGAELVDLHLWNERLALLPSPRRGFARASALRRAIATSLHELARRIGSDPALATVAAVRARAAFVPRKRRRQMLRLARAFGFDTALPAAVARRPARLAAFGENLLILALAWTFNPASLRRREMRRERCELWISRAALLARYGDDGRPGGGAAPCHRSTAAQPPDFALPSGVRRRGPPR